MPRGGTASVTKQRAPCGHMEVGRSAAAFRSWMFAQTSDACPNPVTICAANRTISRSTECRLLCYQRAPQLFHRHDFQQNIAYHLSLFLLPDLRGCVSKLRGARFCFCKKLSTKFLVASFVTLHLYVDKTSYQWSRKSKLPHES